MQMFSTVPNKKLKFSPRFRIIRVVSVFDAKTLKNKNLRRCFQMPLFSSATELHLWLRRSLCQPKEYLCRQKRDWVTFFYFFFSSPIFDVSFFFGNEIERLNVFLFGIEIVRIEIDRKNSTSPNAYFFILFILIFCLKI